MQVKLLYPPVPNVLAAGTSRHLTFWYIGETKKLPVCCQPELCTGDVFHFYEYEEQAYFFKDVHGYGPNSVMCGVEAQVAVRDFSKAGTFELKIVELLAIPAWVKDRKLFHKFRAIVGFEMFAFLAKQHMDDDRLAALSRLFYAFIRHDRDVDEARREIMVEVDLPLFLRSLLRLCFAGDWVDPYMDVPGRVCDLMTEPKGSMFPLRYHLERAAKVVKEIENAAV